MSANGKPDAFQARHLQAAELAQMRKHALKQQETLVFQALVNHRCDPQDPARRAAYETACRDLETLEATFAALLPEAPREQLGGAG